MPGIQDEDRGPGEYLSLARCLLLPRRTLRRIAGERAIPDAATWRLWGKLASIAVLGSMVYGASLALVVPGWKLLAGGLWVTLFAGLAWCMLGPALVLVTHRSPFLLAHACLVTMAYGEGVLVTGAVVNTVTWLLCQGAPAGGGVLNAAVVGVSNILMAAVLAGQLSEVGVPVRTTLSTWLLVLDGCGAVLAYLLRGIL